LTLWCGGAAPTSQPVQRIRILIAQLNDPDSQKRDEALQELLSFPPDQLPMLRAVVAEARPLTPGQLSLLKQAVRHIYISGARYPVAPNDTPFLGLSWESKNPEEWKDLGGVPVARRIPGFAAYQTLREGDVIRGVEELPDVSLQSTEAVGNAVGAFRAGQTIHLLITRNGKPMTVKVLLRNKPLALAMDAIGGLDLWLDEQIAAADQYWDNFFGQVLEENAV
jgi:hypothetical protein